MFCRGARNAATGQREGAYGVTVPFFAQPIKAGCRLTAGQPRLGPFIYTSNSQIVPSGWLLILAPVEAVERGLIQALHDGIELGSVQVG